MNGQDMFKILIIDDDQVDRMRLRRLLRECTALGPYSEDEAVDLASGRAALASETYDLVFLDFQLPDGNGLSFLQELTAKGALGPPVIMQTVLDDEEMGARTVEAGAQDYLVKGRFDSKTLSSSIRYARERHNLRKKNLALIKEQRQLIEALEAANAEVKTLRGFIPICAWCKKVRDDAGFWSQIEAYVARNTEAIFSHGICPECLAKHYHGDDRPPNADVK